ncbi:MAG: iron ABC transporter permease [Candidatus Desulfofervidaceae bacterium]|nr:iron ABC transporter permease [Candidatus Desulfofervidaceae bacterium]
MFSKPRLVYIGLFFTFALVFIFALFSGAVPLHWPLSAEEKFILFRLRFPRVLLGGMVGGALALSGAVLQILFINPLAEPYILGISGGAALGGILALLLGINLSGLGVTLGAFGGALFALAILFFIIGIKGELDTYFFLLAGVILNALFTAIILFISALVKASALHTIYFWLLGDLSTAGFTEVGWMSFFVLICGLVCLYHARTLDAMAQGEVVAATLGISVGRAKRQLLLVMSLLVGATVAVSGMIGFVGLVVPHGIRLLAGNQHRTTLPLCFCTGAGFLILSDAIARKVFAPLEMPVGVITALLGAPFFLYLLRTYVKNR